MKKLLIILTLGSLVLVGCQKVEQRLENSLTNTANTLKAKVEAEQKKQADKTVAMIKCQELCQQQFSTDGQDFEVGPCLSNEIILDWVCDVAHLPRQDVDNNPENQCSAFRQGLAHHFVEVDQNCNVINFY